MKECPHCSSTNYIKHSKTKGGLQQWQCKDCARKFSSKTKKLKEIDQAYLYYEKKSSTLQSTAEKFRTRNYIYSVQVDK